MDGQSSSQKKIVRIRTFQSDVAFARTAQGITAPVVTPAVTLPHVAVQKTYVPPATQALEPIAKEPDVVVTPIQPFIATKSTPPIARVKPITTVVPRIPLQTAKPVPTPKEVKQYGTIAEEIAGISKSHAPSILSDATDPYDSDVLGGGTIIRDTKRKRFKLLPSMWLAIESWFFNTQEAYKESQVPEHTVAKAEKRIDTIVKAATQSEQAPKDDFKKVAEHLKTIERKPIHSTLLFKDKESVPAPTWESAQETDESTHVPVATPPLQSLPEPVPPTAVVSSFEPVIVVPQSAALEEQDIPQPEPNVIAESETQYEEVETKQWAPSTTVVETEPLQEYTPLVVEPVTQYEDIKQEAVPVMRVPAQTPRYAPPRTDKSSLPFYALISVILIASFGGIAFSYYLFAGKSSTVTQVGAPTYEVPKLIEAQDNSSFVLTNDRSELLQTLLSKLETSKTVTQMYPTVTPGGDVEKPAPAEAIVAVLAPRAPGSFTRSIKEITFGSSATAEPFIIIKATSFDVAFAGMLNWETMMSADLAPLFGTTVTETFDPQARTASGAREAFFKDVIASNKNARVLLDENGDDRIVYTFTDQNTILITTNRETLAELIGLVN
jgi:hypothetical protein